MKSQNFKQLALLVIMALTSLILGLICIAHEMKERSEYKTIVIGQDTVKVNSIGEVVR